MDTHILANVDIPKFSQGSRVHRRLAELSEGAQKAARGGEAAELKGIEREVDKVAAKLWGLTDAEMAEIWASLEELG